LQEVASLPQERMERQKKENNLGAKITGDQPNSVHGRKKMRDSLGPKEEKKKKVEDKCTKK